MSLIEEKLKTTTNEIVETIQTNNLQELKNRLEQTFDICADLVEHPLQL
ncbi:spore gernimation protein KA, partial [Bacillus thuringiensis]